MSLFLCFLETVRFFSGEFALPSLHPHDRARVVVSASGKPLRRHLHRCHGRSRRGAGTRSADTRHQRVEGRSLCQVARVGRARLGGRSSAFDVLLLTRMQMHCSISYSDPLGAYLIKDSASQHGTFLNRQRLAQVSHRLPVSRSHLTFLSHSCTCT